VGESRWPMAVAVLLAGVLRITLPPQLRLDDARPLLLVVLAVLVAALIVGDPGRIDRQKTWLRVLTAVLIGLITVVNAGSSVRLVFGILFAEDFTQTARTLLAAGGVIWLTNVIAFGLWYWDLDRGGAAARALGLTAEPAFLFPEMSSPEHVRQGWYPSFVDYLHFSFNTALAFSPTDVSAVKPWAKLMMMAEEAISVVVGILVVARAVNILT
jgi:drug/metabolite transporter (DMT)-like permease